VSILCDNKNQIPQEWETGTKSKCENYRGMWRHVVALDLKKNIGKSFKSQVT
jgi:hypothetical protein